VSQRGVTLGACDGSILLIGTDDGTLNSIVITDGVVLDVTEGVTERNTIGDDDRSIGFAFIGLVLGGPDGIKLVS